MFEVNRLVFNLLACATITTAWWALDYCVWLLRGVDITGGRSAPKTVARRRITPGQWVFLAITGAATAIGVAILLQVPVQAPEHTATGCVPGDCPHWRRP